VGNVLLALIYLAQHACLVGYMFCGIFLFIVHYLPDPTFSRFDSLQYRSVTDRHTHRHTTTAYIALA